MFDINFEKNLSKWEEKIMETWENFDITKMLKKHRKAERFKQYYSFIYDLFNLIKQIIIRKCNEEIDKMIYAGSSCSSGLKDLYRQSIWQRIKNWFKRRFKKESLGDIYKTVNEMNKRLTATAINEKYLLVTAKRNYGMSYGDDFSEPSK